MKNIITAITACAVLVLLPSTTAQAATRADVAATAREVIALVEDCDHPADALQLAYLQARKAVSIVQMTSLVGYTPRATDADIVALVSRVLPLPRTTNSRLLDDGEDWMTRAVVTLTATGVCS